MTTNKEVFRAKSNRVHAIRMKLEEFVATGGDLRSKEAAPLGAELFDAFSDISNEFGYSVLKDDKEK
jgi:hypothetical protein